MTIIGLKPASETSSSLRNDGIVQSDHKEASSSVHFAYRLGAISMISHPWGRRLILTQNPDTRHHKTDGDKDPRLFRHAGLTRQKANSLPASTAGRVQNDSLTPTFESCAAEVTASLRPVPASDAKTIM